MEPLYKKPSKDIVDAAKREKKDQAVLRIDLNEKKKSAPRKGDTKAKVDEMVMGEGQSKVEEVAMGEGEEEV